LSCSGNKLQVQPLSSDKNPAEQIDELGRIVFAERQNLLNVLSPKWYAKADTSLEKARKALEQQQDPTVVLEHVAYARAYLEKAKDYARVSRSVIGDAIQARSAAMDAGAMEYASEFRALEILFLDLTRSIENGDIATAKNGSAAVARDYAALELRAIKEKALGETRRLLQQAELKNAAKLAPITLGETRAALIDTEKFIDDNRYQSEQIQILAADTLFRAKRLEQVVLQASSIATMSPESIYLWLEGLLFRTAQQLNTPDMRNQPFKIQQQNVYESIAALQKDNQYLSSQLKIDKASYEERLRAQQAVIDEQKKRIALLEGESIEAQKASQLLAEQERATKEQLEKEQRFQQQIVRVEQMFSSNQAEVYRQDRDLVIRLKAMNFPVGQALIMPENYALLSTLRAAIQVFGEPGVIIEGHTDSTGSVAMNDRLSQQRADAVREYYVASGVLNPEKVVAIGYGAKRPLAPNDTPEGRAINRRIDVLIRPVD
jgi:outer membrane protein OmpA-like peptidoglycan-associated protein